MQRRQRFDPASLERALFFDFQNILPADLTQDQGYFLDKLRRHNRLLTGWGVVHMLDVKKAADAPNLDNVSPWPPTEVANEDRKWVWVGPGFGLTPLGDELYLYDGVFVHVTHEYTDGVLPMITSRSGCRTTPETAQEKKDRL